MDTISSTDTIQIRNAEPRDFDFVYHIICELKSEALNKETFKKIFLENSAKPHYLYLIAEANAKPIGFLSFHTQNLLHHCGSVGEIQEFYVIENHRGKGIGRKLVEKVKDYAEEHQLTMIEVATNKKRSDNIVIYENLGFKLSHNKFTINQATDH
jgi:PhnO protein